MTIVLDTNVLVSALLRPATPPALVLDLVLSRQIDAALDERIFAAYADVLARVELHLPADRVTAVLDFLWRGAGRIRAATLPIRLPDPDDVMFIEVAVSALASALVTGNTRHYPAAQRHGVRVLTPRGYLAEWSEGRGRARRSCAVDPGTSGLRGEKAVSLDRRFCCANRSPRS